MGSGHVVLPAIVPVRLPGEAELAAAAREVTALRLAWQLADWLEASGVDSNERFRSPQARPDAALALGLISGDGTVTSEVSGTLDWLYEVGYHAEYIHADDHFRKIHRNEDLPPLNEASTLAGRPDDEILADWKGALDALFAHGLDHVIPAGATTKPLDFHGNGIFPLMKLLQEGGLAHIGVLSAEIANTVTSDLPASYGRQQWAAWTAKRGDPTRAFLDLAAELGAVTLDGDIASLTPLATWTMLQEFNVRPEQLPDPADMTAEHVIICRHGMGDLAFARELAGWLAAREAAVAVRELLTTAGATKQGDWAHLVTGVRVAASIEGDTEAAWRDAATAPGLVRPYAIAELSRRAGRSPWRDPLPGLEFLDCDAVVMASEMVLASFALNGPSTRGDAIRRAVDEATELATDPPSPAVLFEQMWRSRHAVADGALGVIGEHHPDKKIAKAARTAALKAATSRAAAKRHGESA